MAKIMPASNTSTVLIMMGIPMTATSAVLIFFRAFSAAAVVLRSMIATCSSSAQDAMLKVVSVSVVTWDLINAGQ